ncbi:ribokinase [Gracilibacillus sp. YIM 98692]|uniref:ribokinase n=1 Tax=Gracilibacillus sp. YIM 98692 TaxID=2663532 RepID=UPI0013D60926|nr:ribokinase [Gracilibacillus sp. YIM 98692]
MKENITVLGSLNYDFLVKQERMPEKGETYTGEELIELSGGKGANQAAQCGKLGLNTYMIGKVGQDQYGTIMIDSLKENHVNTSYLQKAHTRSGMSFVHVMPDGEYYSTILKGANFELTTKDVDEAEDVIKQSKIMIFQLENPIPIIEYAMAKAKENGCYVVLNAAPAKTITQEMYDYIDCLIVNESEASFYCSQKVDTIEEAKKAGRTLHDLFNSLVIVTLGKNGSIAFDGNQEYFQPAQKVKSVDTTGAGDAYTSAIAYGIYHQFDIQKSMAFATEVSAIAVTKDGGHSSFPKIEDVMEKI